MLSAFNGACCQHPQLCAGCITIQQRQRLTPGRSRREKIGENGSKWLANLLYSRPLALKNRYMGQPSRLCTASQPAANHLYLSRELMSELSLVGTNTCRMTCTRHQKVSTLAVSKFNACTDYCSSTRVSPQHGNVLLQLPWEVTQSGSTHLILGNIASVAVVPPVGVLPAQAYSNKQCGHRDLIG